MATAAVTNTFVASTPAEAAEVNTNFTDLVTFLNNSVVHRDGSKAMTANFDAGTNKIINLTAGTAGTDAVNKTQLDAVQALVDGGQVTDLDGTTKYAMRVGVISSTLTTDVNGFVTITAASVGLTDITGFVLTNNYNAVAGSPTCAGVRITSGNAVVRFMKMTDGTAWASSSMGAGHSFIAFGTA